MKTRSSASIMLRPTWPPPARCWRGGLPPPQAGEGRGGGAASLSRRQDAAALRFRQPAQDHPTFEGGDMIDEQHAVEMVDLVLQAGGEEPLGVDLADLV